MDFTELLKRKIAERREYRAGAALAGAEADQRFRDRVAPLSAAVSDMIACLSKDAMFANAFGRPEIAIMRDDKVGHEGALTFQGPAGQISFGIQAEASMLVRIFPNWAVIAALDRGGAYGNEPIRGSLSDPAGLILQVRDHLGDFLADVYFSAAAHLVRPKVDRPDASDT